jgi:hypothetical protein
VVYFWINTISPPAAGCQDSRTVTLAEPEEAVKKAVRTAVKEAARTAVRTAVTAFAVQRSAVRKETNEESKCHE